MIKKKSAYTVAVVGATGAVGTEMIQVLEERDFPVEELIPLASARSEGNEVMFRGQALPVKVLGHNSFEGVDVALFSAGAEVSKEFGPMAVKAGAVVVDHRHRVVADEARALAGRVPRRTRSQLALFEKHDVIPTLQREVVQQADAHHASAHDDHTSLRDHAAS